MSDDVPSAADRGSGLSAGLGPAPWADDVSAWLEASNVEEIADDINRYALAEVRRAVAAERERWTKPAELLLDDALAAKAAEIERLRSAIEFSAHCRRRARRAVVKPNVL